MKRGSAWYAVVRDRTAKKPKWIRLPDDVRTKRQAVEAMGHLQVEVDRAALGLPTKSSVASGQGWLEVAGKVLAEVQAEQAEGSYWFNSCRAMVMRFAGDHGAGDVPMRDVRPRRVATSSTTNG